MKILIATEKPFSKTAIESIKKIVENSGNEISLLEKYEDRSQLLDAVKDAEALIVRSDKIDAEIIGAADKLRIIVRAGAGYDNIDLDAATENEIVVMNTPGQNSNAVAELAIGMMVYLNRNSLQPAAGTELRGKSLGIHAYGYVGKLVGTIGKGFGMQVYAFDPFIDRAIIEKDEVIPETSVEDLYSNCQYISLHIPANEKTRESINYDILRLMPEGATLVNTARKEVIHEESLIKMFRERKDFRYISDIAPDCREEIEKEFPGRFFFTPKKMGAQTAEANLNAGVAAAEQIINYFKKGDTTFKVN